MILNDEDLARQLQDDYYYSLPTNDEQLDTHSNDSVPVSNITSSSSSVKSGSVLQTIWSSVFYKSQPTVIDDRSFTPENFADCRTEKEKLRWLGSEKGQLILSRRPVLNEHYKNGKLQTMIKNRHWDIRLNEWLTEVNAEKVPFGLALPLNPIVKFQMKNRWMHPPHQNPPLDVLFPDHRPAAPTFFPTAHKYEMLIDGFTVFRDVVPLHVVEAAQAAINDMIVNSDDFKALSSAAPSTAKRKGGGGGAAAQGEDPNFTSGVTNERHVLALFYQSPVYALVEALLHNITPDTSDSLKGPSHYHNYTQGAQVAYRFSEARRAHHSGGRTKLGGSGWHIDGMDKGHYGSFSLLVGFPLSDQSADFKGNLCLHAGSHHILNNTYVKTYALQCQAVNSGKPPAELQEVRVPRPVLDEPVQVKVRKGDVVICLHKVGHRGGPNYSDEVRKMVYFRVSHKHHSKNQMRSLDDLWLDYEGMQEVL